MSQSLGLVNLFWGQPLTYPFQGLHLWEQIQKVRHLEVLCVGAYPQLKMLPMCRHQTTQPPSQKPVISLQSLGLGNKKSETDIMLEMMAQQQAERDRQAPKTKSPVATGASAQQKMAGEGAPPPRAGGLGAFKMPEFPTAQYEAAMGMPVPTEAEIAGTRKRAGEEFEQTMPDRTSQLLNERILRKTEQLQKDKDMTFNEALFAAGAAVLSAPGGGGMKWAGEGLKAFGQTMAQGKKDIRKSQDLIDQANIDLAQAQSLRDQGKLAAADKAENKAFDRFAQGRALAQSDAALALQRFNAQVTAAKAPYEIAESQSKAKYQSAYAKLLESGGPGAATAAAKTAGEGIDIGKMNMAKVQAENDLAQMGVKNPTQAQIIEQAAIYYPAIRNVPMPKPQIRGLEAPATLAPGT
jgi:hypothetical protein